MSQKSERQNAIRHILESVRGATQEEICQKLEELGVTASQATLSRDLREMGAVKVHAGDGTPAYRLSPSLPVGYSGDIAHAKKEFVTGLTEIGSFIVIKTKPSNARDFCLVLDRQGWKEIAGTIAGDDTILVITRSARDARTVMSRIES